MDLIVAVLVALCIGLVVGVVLAPKAEAVEGSVLGDMHRLVQAGVLEKDHIVSYVEAQTDHYRAGAEAMWDQVKGCKRRPVAASPVVEGPAVATDAQTTAS